MKRSSGILLCPVFAAAVGCAAPSPPVYRSYATAAPPPAAWRTECRVDRFTDQRRCELSREISSSRAAVAGSLWTDDAGRTWHLTAYPRPIGYRLRVGQNQVISGFCRGPAATCEIAAGQRLTQQLRLADRIAVQIVTVRGVLDEDFANEGFGAALDYVRGVP